MYVCVRARMCVQMHACVYKLCVQKSAGSTFIWSLANAFSLSVLFSSLSRFRCPLDQQHCSSKTKQKTKSLTLFPGLIRHFQRSQGNDGGMVFFSFWSAVSGGHSVSTGGQSGPSAVQQIPDPWHAGRAPRERSGGSRQCRNCGKMFAYADNMVRHRRKCEGVFHLQCPVCGKGFNRRDYFNLHVAKHWSAWPPPLAPSGR